MPVIYTLTQICKNNMILNLPVLVDKLWYCPQQIWKLEQKQRHWLELQMIKRTVYNKDNTALATDNSDKAEIHHEQFQPMTS